MRRHGQFRKRNRSGTVALALAAALAGCDGGADKPKPAAKAETKTATKPDAKAPAAPAKPAPAPTPSLVLREAPDNHLAVWELSAANALRDTGIVASDPGGTMGVGSGQPALSRDGVWVAWLDEGRLTVQHLDGTKKTQITKHKGSKVTVLISGFNPSGTHLLFHQGEVDGMDPVPLPKDVKPGFQLLDLGTMAAAPVTGLESMHTWESDTHVLSRRTKPGGGDLLRVELSTGTEEVLQHIDTPFAFGQLMTQGGKIVYVQHPDGGSQIVLDALGGGALQELSAKGKFAQLQWPQFSPAGTYVGFLDDQKIQVLKPSDPKALTELSACESKACRFGWHSDGAALVFAEAALSVVEVGGATKPIAKDAVGFVIAGLPG